MNYIKMNPKIGMREILEENLREALLPLHEDEYNRAMEVTLTKVPRMVEYDLYGDNLVHTLIRAGMSDLLKYLNPSKVDFHHKNNFGSTPVFTATERNDVEALKVLCNKDWKPWEVNNNYDTVFHVASEYGSVDAMAFLLNETRLNYGSKKLRDIINRFNKKGVHAGAEAIAELNFEIFMLLVDNGLDLLSRINDSHETILYVIKYFNHRPEIFQLPKFRKHVNSKFHPYTFLTFAADRICTPWVIERLVSHGCDPNIPDADGDYPIHVAANRSYVLVNTLLKLGANPFVLDSKKRTILDILSEKEISKLSLTNEDIQKLIDIKNEA